MHDDNSKITYKLAIIKELMQKQNGLVCAAKIRTAQGTHCKATTQFHHQMVLIGIQFEILVDQNDQQHRKMRQSEDVSQGTWLALEDVID